GLDGLAQRAEAVLGDHVLRGVHVDTRCLGGGGEEESSSCDPRCPTYRGKSLLHVPSLRGTGEPPETRGRVSGQRRMVVAVETRAGAESPLDLKVLHRVSTFGNPERCHP